MSTHIQKGFVIQVPTGYLRMHGVHEYDDRGQLHYLGEEANVVPYLAHATRFPTRQYADAARRATYAGRGASVVHTSELEVL